MAVIPSDNKKNIISASRLVIYSRKDMVNKYKDKYGKKPSSENDLLEGLTKNDFKNLTKHYSLGDFCNYANLSDYTKDNDCFFKGKKDDEKISMQGGCTDGTNLYYLLHQKKPYKKSVLIKVFCRVVGKKEGEKFQVYYVNDNYSKFIHIEKGTKEDIDDVLHGSDMTYVPNLTIFTKNNTKESNGAIILSNHHLILVVSPITLNIVNNTMYFKGLYDYKGKVQRKSLYEPSDWQIFQKEDLNYTFENAYSVNGVSFDKSKNLLFINYGPVQGKIFAFCRIVSTSIKYDDEKQRFIEVKPIKYTDSSTSYNENINYDTIYSEYKTVGGIATYNGIVFQSRTVNKITNENYGAFFKNAIFQYSPKVVSDAVERYVFQRNFELTSAISGSVNKYVYYEIENVSIKKLSNYVLQFLIGYKEYDDYVENSEKPQKKAS